MMIAKAVVIPWHESFCAELPTLFLGVQNCQFAPKSDIACDMRLTCV